MAVNPVMVAMEKGFALMSSKFYEVNAKIEGVNEELKNVQRKLVDHDQQLHDMSMKMTFLDTRLAKHTDKISDVLIRLDKVEHYVRNELPTRKQLDNYAGAVDTCIVDVKRVDQTNLMHGRRIETLEKKLLHK